MRLLNFPRMLVIDSKEVGLDPTFLADSKKHLPMETLLHFMALLPHSGSKYCLLHRIVVRIHETKHADSSVQLLSCVRLFATPWTAACQASLSITNSRSLLKLMSIELVKPSNYLLCLQSFPASGSFQMSQFFASGGHSIGVSASASVLPMNIQD